MLTRRAAILAPLASVAATQFASIASAQTAPPGKMFLSMHQNTSRAAGYRGSLEGWAKAGIKHVEITDTMVTGFLKDGGSLADARQIVKDNGLTVVSAAAVLPDVWIPGDARAGALETWRERCEQFKEIGSNRIYCPSITNRRVTQADYDATPAMIRESGDIAAEYELTAMIEFARTSTHLSTLETTLRMIRAADHPNVKPMLDFFHFWSGMSKFEDLDLLEPGELQHCHFQDYSGAPREIATNNDRLIPGDGVTPLIKIIHKLAEKQYRGSLSVELFLQNLTNGDAYEVATEIKTKCDAVMKEAGVL